MIAINNKSAEIKHFSKTVLEKAEVLQSARLNKKQKEALHVIINLTEAINEEATIINNTLFEIIEKALNEQSEVFEEKIKQAEEKGLINDARNS